MNINHISTEAQLATFINEAKPYLKSHWFAEIAGLRPELIRAIRRDPTSVQGAISLEERLACTVALIQLIKHIATALHPAITNQILTNNQNLTDDDNHNRG